MTRSPTGSATSSVAGPVTRMPAGVVLKGDLSASEDILIEGEITGTIDMPSHALTVAAGARVDARVFARDVTVVGALTGKVSAVEIIDIRDTATIAGELAAPAVVVADGARVQARVETKRVDAAVHVARYRMARNGSA